MSHEATNWAIKAGLDKDGNWIVPPFSAYARLILWHIADCHNPIHGSYPTQNYLAKWTPEGDGPRHRSTVNRALRQLEDAGMIRREARVDKATGKRLSTRYRLAFEADFVPASMSQDRDMDDAGPTGTPGDPADVENPVDNPVETLGKNAEVHVASEPGSMSQSFATQTSKEPISPQSPPSDRDLLDEVIAKWRPEKVGSPMAVERAWAALSADDKAAAHRLVDRYRGDLFGLHEELPMLQAYLRQKLFRTFEGAPPVIEGHFRITPDRPEWESWFEHMKKAHGAGIGSRLEQQGYLLTKTRWPLATGPATETVDV